MLNKMYIKTYFAIVMYGLLQKYRAELENWKELLCPKDIFVSYFISSGINRCLWHINTYNNSDGQYSFLNGSWYCLTDQVKSCYDKIRHGWICAYKCDVKGASYRYSYMIYTIRQMIIIMSKNVIIGIICVTYTDIDLIFIIFMVRVMYV